MAITSTLTSVDFAGDGISTVFAVSYVFFGADELEVIERDLATGAETTKTLTTHYTVTGGNGAAGSVTAVAAPPSGTRWYIRRKTARVQNTVYAPNDPFPAKSHERALDRLTALAQEAAADGARALLFPKTDGAATRELPADLARAGKLLGFDASGNLVVTTVGTLALGPGDVTTDKLAAGALSADAAGRAKMADGFLTARKESDDAWGSLASATTPDLGAQNVRNVLITGTTTITGFGNTGSEGRVYRVRFAGALTLTHNATSLILPGGANITTAAGDTAEFVKDAGTGNWRCTDYQRANGQAVAASSAGLDFISAQSASNVATVDFTSGISATYDEYEIHFDAVVPVTNSVEFFARVTTNAGSTWENTTYRGTLSRSVGTAALAVDGTSRTDGIPLSSSSNTLKNTATDGGLSGVLRFWPNNVAGKKNFLLDATSWNASDNGITRVFGGAQWNGANTVLNGIRFQMSSGNISTGNFRLYGVRRV